MYVSDLHFSKNSKRIPVDAVDGSPILVLPAKHTDDDDVFVLKTMVG
jgi:hypothetical protein